MLDLLILFLLFTIVDRMIIGRTITARIRWQAGFRPIKVWAEMLRRYSWANEYLSLNDLESCFSCPIRDPSGRNIYIFEADFHGVPLSKGLESHQPEICIGYYTDCTSYAKTFLYKRNRKGRLIITANTRGAAPDQAPHRPHSLEDLPEHWQEYATN